MSIRQGNYIIAGMTRVLLYDNTGQHDDGAMTQKATTDAINNAKASLDQDILELETNKQDNLIAGTNMELEDNTISTIATQCIIKEW